MVWPRPCVRAGHAKAPGLSEPEFLRGLSQFLDPDLPMISASWDHLKSVWINLLINARDAVLEQNGARKIDIATRLSPDRQFIHVILRDNGIGMTKEQSEHIFEPFYTTKDPGQGTGLGLATCQRIIQQHGGEIEVVSRIRQGTSFIVRLPSK